MKAGLVILAKKSKKKGASAHIDESWLLPYSDLLTLLLALFIVLFASSNVDQEKLQKMSQVFNDLFNGGVGFMEHTSVLENPTEVTDGTSAAQKAYVKDQNQLKEIKYAIDDYIGVNELEGTFSTQLTDEGLLLTIRDSILFDPGSAKVKSEYKKIAKDLAKILELDPPRYIVVTGHTDNVPQSSAEFASNWELSVMRAVNFMKALMAANPNLEPKYFSAKGYGEYNPIASNDTEEGRAKNRRVEVLIQQLVDEDGNQVNQVKNAK